MSMASSVSSLLKQYQKFLDKAAGIPESHENGQCSPLPSCLNVGIIGGGMSGLYSASLLQHYIPGVKVKIFEASERVGGNVHTYRFSPEPNQYFEAGAMRLPDMEVHQPVFSLIEYLNKKFPDNPIELIDFKYLCPEGNRVLVNGTKQNNGHVMSVEYATKNCSELGFSDEIVDGDNPSKLYFDAFIPITKALKTDFEATLTKYSKMSVHDYLSKELGWSFEKINYVEVMCCQSNDFQAGLMDMFFFEGIYNFQFSWKTIQGGMSRLPELCANDIRENKGTIVLNAKVKSIIQHDENLIEVGYTQPNSDRLTYEKFDAVISAIPLPFLRMMPERPHFGKDFECALRLSWFDPMSKLGLRFHSRFWEHSNLDLPPSYGGQSTTDLSSRWVIYPDYGAGSREKGVLHTYNWCGDSRQWRLLSLPEKIEIALHDLQLLYPEVNIAKEYAGGESDSESYLHEAFSMDWWGMTFYNPGQFQSFYPSLVRPQKNLYFAGAHLASSQGWIMSALESSRRAVKLLALKYGLKNIDYL